MLVCAHAILFGAAVLVIVAVSHSSEARITPLNYKNLPAITPRGSFTEYGLYIEFNNETVCEMLPN